MTTSPTMPAMYRRLKQLILAAAALMLLVCVGMVAGPAMNDRAIEADTGESMARVVDTRLLRTSVEFVTADGRVVSPRAGLLYPIGLERGQRVWVEYSQENPELVRVKGRKWTLALWPAVSTGLLTLVILGSAWLAIAWSERRRRS
ncbi:DUF3592 domain-containing protein [Corynebacterium ulceribovis]|uniref:DUF3592 domain-containing protein n=1 Tax=Corynebacterium ulceribovis TaxID=487732 RepID=UPI00047799C8|nr:DUF3592 domain-containing protein [Corynebacterium ulceribovis]